MRHASTAYTYGIHIRHTYKACCNAYVYTRTYTRIYITHTRKRQRHSLYMHALYVRVICVPYICRLYAARLANLQVHNKDTRRLAVQADAKLRTWRGVLTNRGDEGFPFQP